MNRSLHSLCIVLALCLNPLFADDPSRFSADRPVDSIHIKLDLNVDVAGKHVDGTATLDLSALREVGTIRFDAVNMTTSRVLWAPEGESPRPVEYTNDGESVELRLDRTLEAGQHARVTIDYAIDHPSDGLHFFGPSKDEPDVPLVVWSQGESTTNRHWFPCFDHPGEKQTTELVVTAKRGMEVSSNGRLLSRTEHPKSDTVTFHWLQDKRHATYLVSMIVGEFEIERDTWRGRPVTFWAHPRYKDDITRTFKNTKAMLDFFSEKIGIEYPWDRYAQICCEGFGGGMENTSATTLGNWALQDERSSLDSDSDGLIAHELAHQWWGDLLTCRNWSHIWLNEGFASYFEALWDEEHLGDDEFRYNLYRKAAGARRGGAKRSIVDRAYEKPGDMFDSRAYPKGAWVLHMIRRRLGDNAFWRALNKYGTDNAYQNVETIDLRRAIESTTGQSFERFFYDWTERPGHPEVTVSVKWLNDDKLARVSIDQTQEAAAFHFPLTLAFRVDGVDRPVTVTRDITDKQTRFYQPLSGAPDMVSIDPSLSVLMDLKEKKGRDLWEAQLLRDPDPIGRIRAAEHFGESKSDSDRRLLARALKEESFWGLQREIAEALGDAGGDIARDALIDGLDFENPKARRACAAQLDTYVGDGKVIAAIRERVIKGDASYAVESASIETFGKLLPDDAVEVLTAVLKRDSRFETIRRSALSALGELRDPAAVELLAQWAKSDKPRAARPSAIRSLAKITKNTHLEVDTIERIVDTLESALSDTGRRVRGAAVRALGDLDDPAEAKTALPMLRSVAANDGSDRIRKSAKRTIEAIESGEPKQVQLAELRKDLKEAQERNDELSDRIEKLETRLESESKDIANVRSGAARTGTN